MESELCISFCAGAVFTLLDMLENKISPSKCELLFSPPPLCPFLSLPSLPPSSPSHPPSLPLISTDRDLTYPLVRPVASDRLTTPSFSRSSLFGRPQLRPLGKRRSGRSTQRVAASYSAPLPPLSSWPGENPLDQLVCMM